MWFWLGLGAVALTGLLLAPTADARYLRYSTAYRAAFSDALRASIFTDGSDDYGVRWCVRRRRGKFICLAWIDGAEVEKYVPPSYDPDTGLDPGYTVYRNFYCDWYSVMHWRGRQLVVNRRHVACDVWFTTE